jgi:hypothetical protein
MTARCAGGNSASTKRLAMIGDTLAPLHENARNSFRILFCFVNTSGGIASSSRLPIGEALPPCHRSLVHPETPVAGSASSMGFSSSGLLISVTASRLGLGPSARLMTLFAFSLPSFAGGIPGVASGLPLSFQGGFPRGLLGEFRIAGLLLGLQRSLTSGSLGGLRSG